MDVEQYRVIAEIKTPPTLDINVFKELADTVKCDFLPNGETQILLVATSHNVNYPRMIQILEEDLGAENVFVMGVFESSDLSEIFVHNKTASFSDVGKDLRQFVTSDGTVSFSPLDMKAAFESAGATSAMACALLGMSDRVMQTVHDELLISDAQVQQRADEIIADGDEIPF